MVKAALAYHLRVPPLPLALSVTEPGPQRLAPVVVGAAGFGLTVKVTLLVAVVHMPVTFNWSVTVPEPVISTLVVALVGLWTLNLDFHR